MRMDPVVYGDRPFAPPAIVTLPSRVLNRTWPTPPPPPAPCAVDDEGPGVGATSTVPPLPPRRYAALKNPPAAGAEVMPPSSPSASGLPVRFSPVPRPPAPLVDSTTSGPPSEIA